MSKTMKQDDYFDYLEDQIKQLKNRIDILEQNYNTK